MIDIIRHLEELGTHVHESLPYVNRGGCGVYAAAVAKHLERHGVPCKIIMSGYLYDNTQPADLTVIKQNNSNLNTIRDWNENGIGVGHILIMFEYEGKTWIHDTDITTVEIGERDPTCNIPFYKGFLTVEEISKLADCEEGWNGMFDREEGIPEIERLAAIYLN